MLYQTKKLKTAEKLPLAETFIEELQKFRLKSPVLSATDFEAWREGAHDDLVFAVALAAWRARCVPKPRVDISKYYEAPIIV